MSRRSAGRAPTGPVAALGLLPGLLAALLAGCPGTAERGREAGRGTDAATGAGTGAGRALPTPEAKAVPAPTAADRSSAIRFTDVTARSGIAFTHHSGKSGQKYYVEPHSGGAALFDADGDGILDLYLVDGGPLPGAAFTRREGNKLYRGRGDGTFEDITARAGVAGTAYGMGAYVGDADGDGRDDLFVTQFDAPNLLYRNEGGGRFRALTGRAGVGGPGGWNTGAAWFDAERDGDLDLYVVRYVDFTPARNRACYYRSHRYHCSPYDYAALSDLFFRNRGDGTFASEAAPAGLVDPESRGLGALAGDLDGDRWPDLYVAADETPNLLFRNKQDGTFEETGLLAGLAVNAAGATQAGMGLDSADVDGDGRPDLACCNFQNEPNNLYINHGDGRFVDEAGPRGWDAVSRDLLCFAVLFADFELDGDPDAFITCGHVWDNVAEISPGVSYPQRKLLMVNDGRGFFREAAAEAGPALLRPEVSRAAVVGDLDGDGDEDLVYLNIDGPAVVLRNDSDRRDNHWLRVALAGRTKNPRGIGAEVTVEAGGRRWVQELRSNRGFFSSSPPAITFGLGGQTRVDRVRVRWPEGGAEQVVEAPGAVDRELRIEQEGAGPARPASSH